MVVILYFLFLVISLVALFPPKDKKVYTLVFGGCGVVLFLLAAFRSEEISPDYSNYVQMYESADSLLIEPTFIFISILVKSTIGHSLGVFVLYAALAVFLKFKVISQISELWFLSILVYMAMLYVVQEHAQIRAGVATGFFLLTIRPLYERNGKKYLLYSILAILFHYSALITLPLWFLSKRPLQYFLLLLIPCGYFFYFIGGNLIANLPFPYIQDKLEMYQKLQELGVSDFDNINVFGIGVLIKCAIFYWLFFFRSTIRQYNPYIDILLLIYAIGIFFIPSFAAMPVVSYRLSALFVAVEMILFPMLYYIFKQKMIASLVVIFIAFVNLFLNLSIVKILS